MREFMTKVSDYLNERRNNPEKQEDRIAVVIIGAVAVVVIILLLLLLWRYIAKGRSKEEDELVSTTYEEHAAEYMSQGAGEGALTQEYLDNIAYLNDTVEKLLASLTQVEQNLSEAVEQYQEGDTALREEITSLRTEINTIMRSLKATQTKLQDLIDIVQVMNDETIPIIQAQIAELYENINQIYTDIADMYTKFTGKFLQYRYDEKGNILYLEPYQEGSETASSSGNAPAGSLSAYGGQVVYSNKDVAYLDNELGLLLNEIDESMLGSTSADVVFDSADKRRNLLTSRGVINYSDGKVVANAASLHALAEKTDTLAGAYTAAACRALNNIGTYFNADGGANHASQDAGTIVLNCAQIVAGILQSQSVEHLAAAPVTEDNITAGAAAWVNGKCIIGNGADNERAYQRGTDDGAAKNDDGTAQNDEDVDIRYTYHEHTGDSGKDPILDGDIYYSLTNPGGCYVAAGHTHGYGGCNICTGTARLNPSSVGTKDDGLTYGAYYCNVCGSAQYRHTGTLTELPNSLPCGACLSTTTNTWRVDCGKEAGQIETAEVIIRKHKETHE